jgi:hypothetical protein
MYHKLFNSGLLKTSWFAYAISSKTQKLSVQPNIYFIFLKIDSIFLFFILASFSAVSLLIQHSLQTKSIKIFE